MDDMIGISQYGREKSFLFKECNPKVCIEQIDEVLWDTTTSVVDYNFLAGLKQGILIQNKWEV